MCPSGNCMLIEGGAGERQKKPNDNLCTLIENLVYSASHE